MVFSVDQLDEYLLLTGRQTRHADCIVVTRFHPTPRQVVDMYVQMPDAWRYIERACPEHWYDMHILHTIQDPDDAVGQSCGKRRGVNNQFRWGPFAMATYGEAPRTSLVLWAKAFVASTVPAATAASVLISVIICVLTF